MDDQLKTMLRAKAEEMRLTHEMPSGLRQRARRRRAGNAMVTGVVVLGLAVGAFAGARQLVAGRDTGPQPAHPPPAPEMTLPIWPAPGYGSNPEVIDAIQEQVDQGHQPWYLSPQIVAEVFAMEVLQWELDDIVARDLEGDPRHVLLSNPSLPGPMAEVHTILTMERWRGRDDGIFVITRSHAEIIDLQSPVPGQDVGSEEVTFGGELRGISQRLLGLRLTLAVGGGAFLGEPKSTEVATVIPEPDGAFEASIPIPEGATQVPGASIFVQTQGGINIAVEAFRFGALAPSPPAETFEPGDVEGVRAFATEFVFLRTGTPEHTTNLLASMITAEAAAQYEAPGAPELRLCCGKPDDPTYDSEFVIHQLATVDANSYEVLVEIQVVILNSGGPGIGSVWERLFIGPGTDQHGTPRPLVIRGVQAEDEPGNAIAPVPSEVYSTRNAIIAAAQDRDWERLRALIPEKGFTFTYGNETDAIAYWQDLEVREADVLAVLAESLQLERHAEMQGTYIWPAAAAKHPAIWEPGDFSDLRLIYEERQIQEFQELGSYTGWRVGIDEDGIWVFFVAGD